MNVPGWLLTAGSVVLALVTFIQLQLLSRKHPAGWLVLIGNQCAATVYDLLTRQYGFILITAFSVPVAVRGYRRFRSETREYS